jgi:nitrate/TMAO reductase-like tetraheme cytochrome c subunit
MALFINGIIAFLLLAFGLGFVFFYGVKAMAGRQFKTSPRSFLYGLAIPVVLALVFLGIGAFLEYHETAEFCGEMCHSMNIHYDGYVNPENNSMMITHKEEGVTCTGCHVGPGWWSQVEAYYSVPHEMWSEIWNTYDPDDLGAGGLEEESCIKCHDGKVAIKPGPVVTVLNDTIDPHIGQPTCMECHPAHSAGFGVSLDTCELCHGHALDDWEASMTAHEARTGGECLDCHDRMHPEDARVPWEEVSEILDMEFCHDCHPSEYDAYIGTSSEISLELYGDCLACHVEHLNSEAFHPHEAPYDDCGDCHPNYKIGASTHNRTGVSWTDVAYPVQKDLCINCHEDQEQGLDEKKNHRGLECVYCHVDHMEKGAVLEECTLCHDETIPDWHSGSGSCTSSACHGTEWYH